MDDLLIRIELVAQFESGTQFPIELGVGYPRPDGKLYSSRAVLTGLYGDLDNTIQGETEFQAVCKAVCYLNHLMTDFTEREGKILQRLGGELHERSVTEIFGFSGAVA